MILELTLAFEMLGPRTKHLRLRQAFKLATLIAL